MSAMVPRLRPARVTVMLTDGRSATQTLAAARTALVALQAAQDALWEDDLRPALAASGILVLP